MPSEGTVSAVVNKLNSIAQHYSCLGNFEMCFGCRFFNGNIVCYTAAAVGIGGCECNGVSSGLGVESGGVGAFKLLYFGAGHAPNVCASLAFAAVCETETVAGGQGVVENVESCHGCFSINNIYLFGSCQCVTRCKQGCTRDCVCTGLGEYKSGVHAIQFGHVCSGDAPSPFGGVERTVCCKVERNACQVSALFL